MKPVNLSHHRMKLYRQFGDEEYWELSELERLALVQLLIREGTQQTILYRAFSQWYAETKGKR